MLWTDTHEKRDGTMKTRSQLATAAQSIASIQKKVGTLRASQVLSFLMQWAVTMSKNDWQPISVEDLAADWKVPRSTAFRWAVIYREAFPEEHLPNDRILAARAAFIESQQEATPDQIGAASLLIAA